MSKKKGKFDLTHLVNAGYLKEGQKLCFVSDPSKHAKIVRLLNHEYKVLLPVEKATPITVHAFAQQCLGMEPPDHASKWLRAENGKTLFEIWRADEEQEVAA